MHHIISILLVLLLFQASVATAGVRLFNGTLEVVNTSGKACAGRKGNHKISMVFGTDENQGSIFGYVGGETVTVGQLRGQSFEALSLSYPYSDADRAEGHRICLEISGSILTGELYDRHIEDSVDDCNFDLARIKLSESEEDAQTVYQQLSKQFEAQLTRSAAIALSRNGKYIEAVESFEKALALADKLYPSDSARLSPYLTGLANSYIRTNRFLDFISLYDSRIDTLHDESVRLIFNKHQIRSMIQLGKASLGREEHDDALEFFRKALKVDYRNKDAIAAYMSALVHIGQHDEAIAFLEATEQKLDGEPDKKDVREAIALVVYQKAKSERKAGNLVEAEFSLRKAINMDPGTAHYLVVLARWLHKDGKYSEADAVLGFGLDSFKDESRRRELTEAREKLRQTENILAKIRRSGN